MYFDKAFMRGREKYKVITTNYAKDKDTLLIISIADDVSRTISETIFYPRDHDTISEFIRTKFGNKMDDFEIPLYQSIPDWAELACDGEEYFGVENCEIRVIVL